MDLDAFAALRPDEFRALLPGFLAAFLADAPTAEAARAAVAAEIATWSESTAPALLAALRSLGDEHRLYEPLPQARAVARAWCSAALPDLSVEGVEHLRQAVTEGPTFLVGNHLAYLDSTAIDAALVRAGAPDLADRILSLAGPKVYDDPFRRFASGCLATIPVPQSTRLDHTASLSPRELARRALAAIQVAHDALADGRVVLVYAEGSRSRTGRLGPFLPGVARYLRVDGARLVPFALDGTDRVMPVGQTRLHRATVRLRLGSPIDLQDTGGPRQALDRAHAIVTELLPLERRPE